MKMQMSNRTKRGSRAILLGSQKQRLCASLHRPLQKQFCKNSFGSRRLTNFFQSAVIAGAEANSFGKATLSDLVIVPDTVRIPYGNFYEVIDRAREAVELGRHWRTYSRPGTLTLATHVAGGGNYPVKATPTTSQWETDE